MAAEPHFPFLLEGPPAVVPSPPAALLAVDHRSHGTGCFQVVIRWGELAWARLGKLPQRHGLMTARWAAHNPSRNPSTLFTQYMPAKLLHTAKLDPCIPYLSTHSIERSDKSFF